MPVYTSQCKRGTKRPDRQPRKKSGHLSEWSWECCSCYYGTRMLISSTFFCFSCGHVRCPDCPAGSVGLKAQTRPRRSEILRVRCSRSPSLRRQNPAAFISQLLSPEEVVRAVSCSNFQLIASTEVASDSLETNIAPVAHSA